MGWVRFGGATLALTCSLGGLAGVAVTQATPAAAATGAWDPTFGTGTPRVGVVAPATGLAYSRGLETVSLADGKTVVVLVPETQLASWLDLRIARLSSDGSLDTTFAPTSSTPGIADPASPYDIYGGITMQPDGKLLVVTTAYNGGGVQRLNADGTPDTAFGHGGTAQAFVGNARAGGVAVAAGGQVLAGVESPDQTSYGVHRFTSAGLDDPTFNPGGPVTARSMVARSGLFAGPQLALDAAGRILVVAADQSHLYVTRFLSDGPVDASFGAAGTATLTFPAGPVSFRVAVDHAGRVVLFASGDAGGYLARLTPAGVPDSGFGAAQVSPGVLKIPGSLGVSGLALMPDDRIVVAASAQGVLALGRLTVDGRLDRSFNPTGSTPGWAPLVSPIDPAAAPPGGGASHDVLGAPSLFPDGRVAVPGASGWGPAGFANHEKLDMIVARTSSFAGPAQPGPLLPIPNQAWFLPIGPRRVVDMRTGWGAPPGALLPGAELRVTAFQFTSTNVRPAAYVLNVTSVGSPSWGFVSVYPCGSRPDVSNVNYSAGQTIANQVTVAANQGDVCFSASSPTWLIVDEFGYFDVTGYGFHSVAPTRVLDSRNGIGASAPIPARTEVKFSVAGRPGITGIPVAVVLNVTAVTPAGSGWIIAHACGQPADTSNLNYVPGRVVPNMVTVRPNAAGEVCLFTVATTHLLVDVFGWYGPGGDPLVPVTPVRILDTRSGPRIPAGGQVQLPIIGQPSVGAGQCRRAERHGRGSRRWRFRDGPPMRRPAERLEPQLRLRAERRQPGGEPGWQRRRGVPVHIRGDAPARRRVRVVRPRHLIRASSGRAQRDAGPER